MESRHAAPSAPPSTLTPDAITDAALALACNGGLETVSIRKLAARLGVTPMAIYWHVPNKDALLDAMAGRLFDAAIIPGDPSVPWPERLRILLSSLLAVVRTQPEVATLLSTRTVRSASGLAATDAMLDILRLAGFSPEQATQVGRLAIGTISNLVTSRPGTVGHSEGGASATTPEANNLMLDQLPADRYPRLREAAGPLSRPTDPDAYDAFGLDLLMAGIVAMAPNPGDAP
ncbi:MAG: TetR family transcriptional regulator [Thermomicrobiales bacterium]